VDTNLAIQDNESGVWGGKHRWADREHWTTISSCIDLDGVYGLSRGSLGAGKHHWSEVQQACSKYLRTAQYILSNCTMVVDPGCAAATHTCCDVRRRRVPSTFPAAGEDAPPVKALD
jgi:hypothetical protein